jgi:hypothetical protein
VSYRKVEYENVGRVPHCLVEDHYKNHEEVANEADDDYESEDDWDDHWDDCYESLEVTHSRFLVLIGGVHGGGVVHPPSFLGQLV